MKQVMTLPDSAELGLLKNMLQKGGIRCLEINEQIAQTFPMAPFQAELWIENDTDYQAAVTMLEKWKHPADIAGPAWICPRCGEKLENQFGRCWKCGSKRAGQE
jgi:hypothetical protein